MAAPRPIYLVASPGPSRDRVGAALGAPSERVFDSAAAFLPLGERDPGVVAIPTGSLPADEVGDVLVACALSGSAWTPVLAEEGSLAGVPILAGYRYPLADVATSCATGEGEVLLSLPEVIDRVRAGRHDINNPLAAALAETQLLLMDAEDQELRRSLEVIQEQLRRIKDLVASLRGLRPPQVARPPAEVPRPAS